jgi:hypothetical protein
MKSRTTWLTRWLRVSSSQKLGATLRLLVILLLILVRLLRPDIDVEDIISWLLGFP